MNLQKKQKIISEIKTVIRSASSIVVADFCGLAVDKMTRLRKKAREASIYIRIIRNTLLRRAVEGTTFECLKTVFVGPTLIACSMEHPGAAVRLFKEFAKTNARLEIRAVSFEGKIISVSQVDRLATLPTYKEAIMCLAVIMKEAAAGKLVRALAFVLNKKKASL